MNSRAIKKLVFSGSKKYEPNTFIGGAGEEYTTAMELATVMDIPYVAIKNFRVDANNNISCRIDRDYNITTNAFSKYLGANHKFERYYIDVDGLLKETHKRTFAQNPKLKMLLPGLEIWGSQSIGHTYDGPLILYAKNLTNVKDGSTIGDGYFAHDWRNGADRVYIPNYNPPYENTNQWYNFQQNNAPGRKNVAYVSASFFNHPNTVSARTKSGVKLDARIVTNFDCPNAVEDLSVATVTANTVQVDFTTPAPSTNPIDFYEVWLEELGVNDPEYRYFPRTEITASGETITGLKPNTNYALRLATVDTLYNGSGVHSDENMRRFSNQVIFQTLPL